MKTRESLFSSLQPLFRLKWPVILAFLLLFGGQATVFGQSTNGRFVVTVKDQTGAVISGATVTVVNEGTNQEVNATTNESGIVVSPLLPIGLYDLKVEIEGFKKAISEKVKLDIGQEYGIVITLEAGGTTEIVTINAGEELVQTTDAEVKSIVTEKQVQELPLNGRSPLDLIQLQAGVNGQLAATTTVINGQRSSSSTVTQDGINIQDLFIRTNALDFSPNRPTVAQVSEFSVTTLNPGAETGGSSAVKFVTPSGTNTYHGSLFEFHRNSAVAANDFFSNLQGIAKPQLIRNQFGYTLSGPLSIPGVINGKDKLFFFTSYEGFRERTGSPAIGSILLPAARQGVFTYRDNSGQRRTLDILGLKKIGIDPAIAGILAGVPTTPNTNLVGDGLNTSGFAFNKSSPTDRDTVGFRIDYNMSSKSHFEGVYQHASEDVARPDIDTTFNQNLLVSNQGTTNFFVISWNYTFSTKFNNEVRIGRNVSEPVFVSKQNYPTGTIINPLLVTNPTVTFQGQGRRSAITSIIDSASYSAGNHFLRFGGQVDITRVRSFNSAGIVPTINLGISTAAPQGFGLTSRDFPGGIDGTQLARANSLLAFLGGVISSASVTFNATSQTSGYVPNAAQVSNLAVDQYSGYVSDSWRVRPRLTLILGVRYDFVTPLHEQNNFALLPERGGTVSGLTDAKSLVLNPLGRVNFVNGNYFNSDKNNFAPNVSFAFDIPKLGRQTVIRGGYSIQYINDEAFRAPDNATAANSGLSTTRNLTTQFGFISKDLSRILSGLTPPPFKVPVTYAQNLAINPTSAAFIVDPNFKTPYYQQFNLSIEREVFKDTVVTARYVGNLSRNLSKGVDFNQLDVFGNGFANDVIRARQNGFLALAKNGTFDPRFNANIPGSQQLSVFPQLAGGGLLTNSTIRSLILTGEAGTLAQIYLTNGLAGKVAFVPNPSVFVADVLLNGSESDYHSLQLEVRRRFANGFQFQANYTFSKVLTNAQGTGQTRFEPLLDNAQPSLERSRAPFDVKHSFKTNFLYELPFGPGKMFNSSNKVIQKLIGGYQLNSIISAQTGAPFSILSQRGTLNRVGRSANNTANTNLSVEDIKKLFGTFVTPDGTIYFIDPKVIGKDGSAVAPDGQSPFAGQVFFNPGPGQVGSLSRLAFDGPNAFNWDLSLIKTTRISERVGTEFRAEFFNVLNHPIFFIPDQNINSTTFGQINSSLISPRIIQFAFKVTF